MQTPELSGRLLAWYARAGRSLPWRATRDPYAVWVSEVLLQQTRVEAAIPYYRRFLAAFPTVEALAAARLEEVLRVWEGLGYYARARNLHRAARLVVRRGAFPTTVEGWLKLPGVGPYTAAAVASIAFGCHALALDGNVLRVGARLLGIEEPIEAQGTRRRIREALERLIPPGRAGPFNQALMDLGATVCLPRAPRCGSCPIEPWCAAAGRDLQDVLPRRRRRALRVRRRFVAAVVRDASGSVLLVRRPPHGIWGGLWALPEVEAESWPKARPVLERIVGARLRCRRVVGEFTHAFTHFEASYTVVEAEATSPVRVGRFVRPDAPGLALPALTRKILKAGLTVRPPHP